MRVVFRTDASLTMGNGHVMRCITLAYKLRSKGCTVEFICRKRNGDLIEKIKLLDFKCHTLPFNEAIEDERSETSSAYWEIDAHETLTHLSQPVDWIVVDHYALDWKWERIINTHCTHLLVIDDLANRKHDCTVLVDHNIGRLSQEYVHLVNKNCTLLLGPKYALIRDEFFYRERASSNSSDVLNILISMGGVDKINLTTQLLSLLQDSEHAQRLRISIILGPHSPWNRHVVEFLKNYPIAYQIFIDPPNIATLISEADIAIGTSGVSALERCSLHVPSINFVVADNQLPGGLALERLGACRLVTMTDLWNIDFHHALKDFMNHAYRSAMQQACAHVVDGQGTEKITEAMQHGD